VQTVRFADDQAVMANTNASLQRIMESLHKTYEEYGMKINLKKTKVMRISRYEGKQTTIKIDGEKLEQVKQFNYLGSTMTEDCKSNSEIRRCIILEKEAFNKNKKLLRGKLELNLKKKLEITLIWSGVIYGSRDLDNAERRHQTTGII
jgi:Reverse transcriptase (RNA-dependent DNA polymerase)